MVFNAVYASCVSDLYMYMTKSHLRQPIFLWKMTVWAGCFAINALSFCCVVVFALPFSASLGVFVNAHVHVHEKHIWWGQTSYIHVHVHLNLQPFIGCSFSLPMSPQSLQQYCLPGERIRESGKFKYLEEKLNVCKEQVDLISLYSTCH